MESPVSLGDQTLNQIFGGHIVDCAIVAKVMDPDTGQIVMQSQRTYTSSVFELIGMLTAYVDTLRNHCQSENGDTQ